MERYTNTILNKQGKPVAGAVVTVTTYPGNEPAVIYAADGGRPVESVSSDENGRFAFYAADGHYNLSITGKHVESFTITDVVLNDPNDEASLTALAADNGADKIGGTWFGGVKAKLSQFATAAGSALIGFIQAAAGAVSRSVQDKLRDTVSVKDFGAKGDGVTDDTAAIQAALTAAVAKSEATGVTATLYFPNGAYRMRGRAEAKFTSTTSQQRGLCIKGDGLYATVIIADPTNVDGLFKLGSVTTNEVFEVSALSLLSDLPEDAPTNNGAALEIYTDAVFGGAGWGDRPLHTVFVHEVYISGKHDLAQGFARRGNFSVGIKVTNKYNPKFSHVRILGRYGKSDLSARTGCEAGIQLQGCYSPWFNYVYVHGNWNYGIVCDGQPNASEDIEGFSLNMCILVNSNYGFAYRHSYDPVNPLKLYEPGGTVQGSHFDCKKRGIWVRSHQQIQITNSSVYAPRSKDQAVGELIPCGIYLENASFVHIRTQVNGGWYTDTSDFAAGIVIQGYSDVVNIECDFSMSGVGVYNNSLTAEKTISMVNSKWERRTSELSPQLLPFTPFVDLTNSMLVQYVSQTNEGGKWKNRFNVAANNTGASPSLSFAMRTYNQDYATRANPTLAGIDYFGLNSGGVEVRPASTSAAFRTNAAGAEYGDQSFWCMRNGALAEAMKLTYVDGELNTALRLQGYVNGAWVTKAVTLGAADSGGAGKRLLVVSN